MPLNTDIYHFYSHKTSPVLVHFDDYLSMGLSYIFYPSIVTFTKITHRFCSFYWIFIESVSVKETYITHRLYESH